ncbi:hypothetical protein E5D57_001812 [Metarhizium anisopliae]|nr:hypothetical protein E5D57_001812 [Metarhizium anisopliae]
MDEFERRRLVRLSRAQNPVGAGNDNDDPKGDDAVVHVDRIDRPRRGPDEEDSRQQRPGHAGGIAKVPHRVGQLEAAVLGEHAPPAQHVDARGDGVGDGEANDGSRDDGVEGAGRAEKYQPEDNVPREAPEEPGHRGADGRADAREMAVKGHAAVAGERVGYARAGGHVVDGAEDKGEEREEHEADAAGLAPRGLVVDLEEWLRGRDGRRDIADDGEDGSDVAEAGDDGHDDGVDDEPRALARRVRHLLDHVDRRVTELPGPAVGPAGLVDESAKDKLGALKVGRRTGQDGHEADDEAGKGEEHVVLVQVAQEAVGEQVVAQGNGVDGNVQEESLPRRLLKAGIHELGVAHDDAAHEQAVGAGQAHPRGEVDPAGDVADGAPGRLPARHGRPVVLAAGGGIGREELGEREAAAQVEAAGDDDAPNGAARPARRQGGVDRRADGAPRVDNGKGHPQHGEVGEGVAVKVGFDAQQLEGGVGLGGGLGAPRPSGAAVFLHLAGSPCLLSEV